MTWCENYNRKQWFFQEIDAAETIEKYLSGFNMLKSVTKSKTADSTKIEFATSDDTVALINEWRMYQQLIK